VATNKGWGVGVYLYYYCSSNSITGNNLTNNWSGIQVSSSDNNNLSGNNITNNQYGIWLNYSSYNKFYHNYFIDNGKQVFSDTSPNFWDDGYPSGGNYWSDYKERYPNAKELDGSGLWDTPYVIDEANQDSYPLIPEFPSAIIIPLFMVISAIAIRFAKKEK
jgi:parallel beta-helix repeat protein